MAILIFQNSQQFFEYPSTPLKKDFEFKLWHPSFKNLIPPFLSKKYIYWWLAHYFGIFRNKDYSAIITYDKSVVIGIIVITPAYSRWSFMDENDLQITNVNVAPNYRGQGIAQKMINIALEKFSKQGRRFWYITTSENVPSIKLCEKAGFQLVGKGEKVNHTGLKGFRKINLIPIEKALS